MLYNSYTAIPVILSDMMPHDTRVIRDDSARYKLDTKVTRQWVLHENLMFGPTGMPLMPVVHIFHI